MGVNTGSIERRERRTRGVDCEMIGVIKEYRIVGIIRVVGQK